ncbi:hypothetical protein M752DRAFT_276376 [Aspergillus phoenicis ATCC 13157]|uniref:Secreted protein n=1 Tax=Aspergillus phoenicis ATCC 13157 TaxID=1353007 RepID=A0A370PKW9_ASPPH|nr:hypothetical protein M752DRAFT_276376 [Aspergillus phoenicis ATCC 13157]
MPLLRLSLLFLSDRAHGDGHTRPPLITARSRKSSRAKWEVHQRRNVSVQASLARKQWTLFIAPFVRSSIQLSATSNYVSWSFGGRGKKVCEVTDFWDVSRAWPRWVPATNNQPQ